MHPVPLREMPLWLHREAPTKWYEPLVKGARRIVEVLSWPLGRSGFRQRTMRGALDGTQLMALMAMLSRSFTDSGAGT